MSEWTAPQPGRVTSCLSTAFRRAVQVHINPEPAHKLNWRPASGVDTFQRRIVSQVLNNQLLGLGASRKLVLQSPSPYRINLTAKGAPICVLDKDFLSSRG